MLIWDLYYNLTYYLFFLTAFTEHFFFLFIKYFLKLTL